MARRTSKLKTEYDNIDKQIDLLRKEQDSLDISHYSRPSYTSSDGMPELSYAGEDDARYDEIEEEIAQLEERQSEIESKLQRNKELYGVRKASAKAQGLSVG